MRQEWRAGLAVAAVSVATFAWFWRGTPGHPDFDQLYAGALALRDGLNPYSVVGPGLRYEWATALYYPLPALLVVMPLTFVPIRIAGGIFVAVSGFALGFAIERTMNRWRYLLLLSCAFVTCIAAGQWTVLLLAAVWLPIVGSLAIAKPNIGAIVAFHWSHWRDFVPALIGVCALLIASFVVRPSWFGEWRTTIGPAAFQQSPILYPGGFLVLAALARWRDSDARYLVAYACIPQTPGPYSDLLLFAIPRTKWEVLILALLSYITMPLAALFGPLPTLLGRLTRYGRMSALVLMLPCLVMVLARKRRLPMPTDGVEA
jgi:hypothetical protein